MKKHLIIAILFSFVFFSACKSSKLAGGTGNDAKTNEPTLTEEQHIEFQFLYIEGLKQKMLGNFDPAIQYFHNCLEINPQSAASMYELANIYAKKNELISAKLLLDKATKINPENKWYKLLLAQIFQNEKQFEKASEVYEDLIAMDPDNVEYHYINALLYTSSDNFEAAIEAYNQIEKLSGFNEQLALARQNLYLQTGEDKKAYEEIEKLISLNPQVPEYYGILADMYKENGDDKKALEYYKKVLEIDPENGFVHFSLATFYLKDGNFDEGLNHAKTGFGSKDVAIETKIQLYLMLSSAPEQMNIKKEDLEELIQLVIVAHPEDARSYSIMADYLINNGRKEEARSFMEKALKINPNSYALWEQLIISDNELQDFESMERNSDKTIQLFPAQPLPYVLNAVANIQLENYEKAIQSLENGQIYVSGNNRLAAQFELYRAEAYYNMERSEDAFEAFEKVIKIDPENYMAMNNYAYYLSVRGEQLERAEILSSKVIQAHPNNPTYLDTHAWVLFKKKEYRLAKFYMDTALQNGGEENAVLFEHYGDILFMMNEAEEALKYWIKSRDQGNKSQTLIKKIEEKKYIEGDE